MSEYSYEKKVQMYASASNAFTKTRNINPEEELIFDTAETKKTTGANQIDEIVDEIWNDVSEKDWLGLPTTGKNLGAHLNNISQKDSLEIYERYSQKHGETMFSSIITEYGLPIDTRIKYCKDLFNKMAKEAIKNGHDKEEVKNVSKEYYAELDVQKNKIGPANADNLNKIAQKLFKKYNYELGERVNGERIVDVDSISTRIGNTNALNSSNGTYSSFSIDNPQSVVNYINENVVDSNFTTSCQQSRGNCYLMAEINSIRNTDNGAKILAKNIKNNGDGSYTITLPGALEVRKEYAPKCKEKGIECPVTGKYRITADAVEKAKKVAGSSYSRGDLTTILFEVAMENYRYEVNTMFKALGINRYNSEFGTVEDSGSAVNEKNNNDYLSGGFAFDASFILTGKKCEDVYQINQSERQNVRLYDSKKYPRISRAEFDRRFNSKNISAGLSTSKGMQEYEHLTRKKSDVDKLLDKYEGKESDYALTFGVICAKDGPDGHTEAGGGHALSVLKITSGEVYVANPWHPDEIEIVPRQEFLEMCTGFTATDMR